MSYAAMIQMSESGTLQKRIVACAAQEGTHDPESWVYSNRWTIFSLEDWISAWEYAETTKTINNNPDTGARTDVITDQAILSAVQALLAS